MRHLLLHAAGNIRARALRQMQLHDIALLAPRMKASDWSELLATNERAWTVVGTTTAHAYSTLLRRMHSCRGHGRGGAGMSEMVTPA